VDATATQSRHQADGTRHEKDGDTHGWLKVDSGFENLLNSGNINDEDGNLVFEIICRFPITQTDVRPHAKVTQTTSHCRPSVLTSVLSEDLCRIRFTVSGMKFIR